MSLLGRIGAPLLGWLRRSLAILGISWAVVREGLRPRTWSAPVRAVLARQILFTGIEAMRFVGGLGVIIGIAVVLQTWAMLMRFGRSDLLGPVLVTLIVRELGPLLTNFIVIGRSGNAIATELATMKIRGEVRLLEGSGVDPFLYLVIPRAVGMALSMLGLGVLFVVVTFASATLVGTFLRGQGAQAMLFTRNLFAAVTPTDLINLVAKLLLPGMLIAVICAREGLSVRGAATEVPQAATRGVMRSVAALFVVILVASIMTYR